MIKTAGPSEGGSKARPPSKLNMDPFATEKSLNLPQKTPQPTLPEEMGRHQMALLSQECGTEVSMHLASCGSHKQECEEGRPKPANNTHGCHLLSAAVCRQVLTLLLHTEAMLHDTEKFSPPASASLTSHVCVCTKTCIVQTARAGPCKDVFCVESRKLAWPGALLLLHFLPSRERRLENSPLLHIVSFCLDCLLFRMSTPDQGTSAALGECG